MDFAFVAGVAICGVCNRGQVVPTLKAAQTLRHHAFSQHVTGCQGLAFYTPHVNGPPTVAVLAEALSIGHVFAAMPVTPTGEHIRIEDYEPIPQNDTDPNAVRDAENVRDDLPASTHRRPGTSSKYGRFIQNEATDPSVVPST